MNVSSVAYQVITSGYATYSELSTIYSLEDALNLIEVHQVSEYNKRLVDELSKSD
ncbi:hypothetical protein KKJ17_14895 [Xenorhabdus bovienii]|uniref:Uncharacterized protein n=1 Tax=Xenorhabdus bovienii TaxID=40576 RepID=A0AAJ1N0V0_XENBV|nr:hypothetical protein [Xenorhabdus bovienii]MDE1479978.1 hypothetical protein [Xenorhabdus bovienii]MDE9511675.1 hypothetical protein [Xenorhabdus bovienii]MDE9518980.1 hypothetical protein [Xenorhabdus bovienii]MDE9523317.1 hypothetical protein [Xenorhabdus bovienii]